MDTIPIRSASSLRHLTKGRPVSPRVARHSIDAEAGSMSLVGGVRKSPMAGERAATSNIANELQNIFAKRRTDSIDSGSGAAMDLTPGYAPRFGDDDIMLSDDEDDDDDEFFSNLDLVLPPPPVQYSTEMSPPPPPITVAPPPPITVAPPPPITVAPPEFYDSDESENEAEDSQAFAAPPPPPSGMSFDSSTFLNVPPPPDLDDDDEEEEDQFSDDDDEEERGNVSDSGSGFEIPLPTFNLSDSFPIVSGNPDGSSPDIVVRVPSPRASIDYGNSRGRDTEDNFILPPSRDTGLLLPTQQPTMKKRSAPSHDLSEDLDNLDLVSNRINSITKGLGSSGAGSQSDLHGIDEEAEEESGNSTKHSVRLSSVDDRVDSGLGTAHDESDTENSTRKPRAPAPQTARALNAELQASYGGGSKSQRADWSKSGSAGDDWSDSESSDSEREDSTKANLRDLVRRSHLSTDETIKSERNGRDDAEFSQDESSEEDEEDRLSSIPPVEWLVDDVTEWLELIGLGHVSATFKSHNVNGKCLLDIGSELLEAMDMIEEEDRELILEEIYTLQEDVGDNEMDALDALDQASGDEKRKMRAILEALQNPTSGAFVGGGFESDPEPSPSLRSARSHLDVSALADDSEANESTSAAGMFSSRSEPNISAAIEQEEEEARAQKAALISKMAGLVSDPYIPSDEEGEAGADHTPATTGAEMTPPASPDEKKKKKKKRSFLNLSFRRQKKKKKDKADAVDVSKNPGTQGVVRVFVEHPDKQELEELRLLVSMATTSEEVCGMCLEKMALDEDASCYFLAVCKPDGKSTESEIRGDECPLHLQSKWSSDASHRFELRSRTSGSITVHYTERAGDERRSVTLAIGAQTTMREILPVVLRRFQLSGVGAVYHLEVDGSGGRESISELSVLLHLPTNTEKQHVFNLVQLSSQQESSSDVGAMKSRIVQLEHTNEKLLFEINNFKATGMLKETEDEAANLKAQLKQRDTEINKLKNKLEDEILSGCTDEHEVDSLREERRKLNVDISKARAESRQQKERIAALESIEEKLTNERDELEQKLEDALNKPLLAATGGASLTSTPSLELETLRLGNRDLASERDELCKRVEALQSEIATSAQRPVAPSASAVSRSRVTDLEADATELRSENSTLTRKLDEARSRCDSLERETSSRFPSSERLELVAENENLRSELLDLQAAMNASEIRVTDALEESEAMKRECDAWSSKFDDLEEAHERLKAEYKKQKSSSGTIASDSQKLQESIDRISLEEETQRRKAGSLKNEKEKLSARLATMEVELREREREKQELRRKLEEELNNRTNKSGKDEERISGLYKDNKGYLQRITQLEEKLSETEDALSRTELLHEEESHEIEELRQKYDSLEAESSAKDSKVLDLVYKLQRKDRDVQAQSEQLEDEVRKRKRDLESSDNIEQKNAELSKRVETMKIALEEKDQQINILKIQMNKLAKKHRKEKGTLEEEFTTKQVQLKESQIKYDIKLEEMQRKLESLQKLNVDKDLTLKQKEFSVSKEKEDLEVALAEMQRKLATRDALVERIENKIAKSELTSSSHLEEQKDMLKSKENLIQELETTIAKLESEQASKLRESAGAVRAKETAILKLESKVKKLETTNRENQKKIEKHISEKDSLVQNVAGDRDQEIKDLKQRLRESEERTTFHEKKLRETAKLQAEQKEAIEARLKKRDREYLQQKRLLERVLAVVKAKAPQLLKYMKSDQSSDTTTSPTKVEKDDTSPVRTTPSSLRRTVAADDTPISARSASPVTRPSKRSSVVDAPSVSPTRRPSSTSPRRASESPAKKSSIKRRSQLADTSAEKPPLPTPALKSGVDDDDEWC